MKPQNLRSATRPAKSIGPGNSQFKPEDPVNVISNLLEKAINSPRPIVKSKFATDLVNDLVEKAYNLKLSSDKPTHPVDEFFDSLKTELFNRRPFVKSLHPLDVANFIAGAAFTNRSAVSDQKLEEIFNSLKKLYISSVKSTNAIDPVNDMVKGQYEIGHILGKPKNSFEKVRDLIKKSLGPEYRSIKPLFATDSVNDFIAAQIGAGRPSAETLSVIQSKLLDATYQLHYKMSSGTEEYTKKAKEIDQLKGTIKKLQDNLTETDR
ncbi:MAG: hypothetical protein ABSF81_07745 [Bacteroidales bacterium]|jgi:hypothetical protein